MDSQLLENEFLSHTMFRFGKYTVQRHDSCPGYSTPRLVMPFDQSGILGYSQCEATNESGIERTPHVR
jgi:hypothetical protein